MAGSPFAAGASPRSLAFGASGKFLYTANPGGTTASVSGFTVDATSGALTALSGSPFPLPVINSIAADRTGAYLYLTTTLGVAPYGIDAKTGLLTELDYPFAAGLDTYAVTTDATNQFLYVTNEGSDTVSGFQLDSSSGDLVPVTASPFPAGHSPDFVTTL
jgi:6-phosphogluconolactonase (cycloisomerase 2 family)